jgi:hypothetical protein
MKALFTDLRKGLPVAVVVVFIVIAAIVMIRTYPIFGTHTVLDLVSALIRSVLR